MSDTARSLNTSGLAPKKQIQCWSDALTDLCGPFDIDPLQASSFEGRINYTTVSKLKLCQIDAGSPRAQNWAAIRSLKYCSRLTGFRISSKAAAASS